MRGRGGRDEKRGEGKEGERRGEGVRKFIQITPFLIYNVEDHNQIDSIPLPLQDWN